MRDLTPKNIKRQPYHAPEVEKFRAPDGYQWRCAACKRDMFGVWKEGTLHVRHNNGTTMIINGVVRANCRRCGLENLLNTGDMNVAFHTLDNGNFTNLLPVPSPQANKLMKAHHLSIFDVPGTGTGGQVTVGDVRTYVESIRQK